MTIPNDETRQRIAVGIDPGGVTRELQVDTDGRIVLSEKVELDGIGAVEMKDAVNANRARVSDPGDGLDALHIQGPVQDPGTGLGAEVSDPGIGTNCLAVQTTPIPGAPGMPVSPVMLEGLDNVVALGGAAPQELIVTLDMASIRGKLKTLRVYEILAPINPYTVFDIGVYQALPVIGIAALPDGPGAMFRAVAMPISALGMILNQVMVGEILFRNRDDPATTNLYVVLRGTVGGGIGAAGTYSIELLAEELVT